MSELATDKFGQDAIIFDDPLDAMIEQAKLLDLYRVRTSEVADDILQKFSDPLCSRAAATAFIIRLGSNISDHSIAKAVKDLWPSSNLHDEELAKMGAEGAASGMSIAATGLQAYGDYEKGAGIQAGDEFKAAELERAAQYGELKAKQTGAQLTRNLNITLGNLDAVRAAARTDPTSPTGTAVRDYTEQQMTEQKEIQVGNILAQVRQNEADAAYLRYAGNQALLAGEIGAGADILGGLGGAFKSGGGGVSGTPNPAAQYTTGAPY